MAVELATAYVSLVPSARGMGAGISRQLTGPAGTAGIAAGEKASRSFADRFSSGLSKAGKAMARTGDKLTLGITAPLIFAGKKLTDFASNLNESRNATRVVFGDAEKSISRYAKTSAESMGLSERAFREAVTPMGAMLQNVGFSQDEAAESSVKLSQRAADMASVFNTDVSDALDAINAGLRGESDPLERFGVGLNEAAVKAEALRLGLVKEGEELTSNQKAQARLSLIMSQTDKIKGDFANTSDESANAQRIEAARAEDAAAAFGQKLLPIKLKLIRAAGRLLTWFNGLSEGQQDMAIKAAGVAAALGPVLSITGRLARGIAGTVRGIAAFGRGTIAAGRGAVKITQFAASGAKAFAQLAARAVVATARVVAQIALQVARWAVLGTQALLHAAKVAAAWLISLGPIGLVIAAVAGAAALIIKYWDEIKAFVTAAARAVVDFLKKHWPLILAILGGPIGLAVALIIKNWDRIKAIFLLGVEIVLGIWRTAWNTIWSIVQGAWRRLSGFFAALPGRLKGFFSGAVRWLVEGGRNILRGLRNGIDAIWAALKTWFGDRKRVIQGFFSGALGWLIRAGRAVIRGMWNGIRAVWSSVVGWFKDLPGKVLRALGISSPPKWAVDAGRWVMRALMKGLGLGVGSVMDFMSGLAGKFTGALRSAWDSAWSFLFGGGGGGDFSGVAAAVSSRANQALGQRMAAARGWTGAQWSALNALVMSESGWSNTAQNPVSTAYGIGQFLNSTWATVGARKTSDPAAQIAAMLRYIAQRYGTPAAAWAFKRAHNWYHEGGVASDTGLAFIRRSEVVFTPDQLRVLGNVFAGGGGGAPTPVVLELHDADRDFVRWLRKAIRTKGGGDVQVALGQ